MSEEEEEGKLYLFGEALFSLKGQMSAKVSMRKQRERRHIVILKRRFEEEGYETKLEEYTDEKGIKHTRVVKGEKKA